MRVPREIVIVSDKGNPEWIAADLIAQAEHDPQARALLDHHEPSACDSRLTAAVTRADAEAGPARRIARAPRRHHHRGQPRGSGGARQSRWRQSTSCAMTTALRLQCVRPARSSSGRYTAQVAGDYAIGSNHVLPTNGAARFRGGLHTADFVRVSTVQRMTRRGLKNLAPTVITLAREEGLDAHARSIEVRVR